MDYIESIQKSAETFRIDINLIKAIAKIESGGNPFKVRFEPKWRYLFSPRTFADKLYLTVETETLLQSCSWGLLQCMGSVARELGFQSDLTMLTQAEIGLFYGCKKLRQLFDKYGDETDVISSYNQGSPRKTPGGQYENMLYVDKVSKELRSLRKIV